MGDRRSRTRDESNDANWYAHDVAVGHNAVEFRLEFGQLREGDAEAVLHVRIPPRSAKLLLQTLQESIARYEATFGSLDPTDE